MVTAVYLTNSNDTYVAFGLNILPGSRSDVQPRIIYARDGDDYAMGGRGDDTIYGGAGNDTLHGGQATLTDGMYYYRYPIFAGHDRIYGDAGDDVLDGGDGNDVLHGGGGSNLLRGGAGDDLLDVRMATMLVERPGIEDIHGWIAAKRLASDVLHGDAGNDRLEASFGNDRLFGDAGDDWVAGRDGNDWIEGGDGKDVLRGDAGRHRPGRRWRRCPLWLEGQ